MPVRRVRASRPDLSPWNRDVDLHADARRRLVYGGTPASPAPRAASRWPPATTTTAAASLPARVPTPLPTLPAVVWCPWRPRGTQPQPTPPTMRTSISGRPSMPGGTSGLTALSDNSANGSADSKSGGIVAVGEVHSVVTASGTTQAYVNRINSASIGGNLNVMAEGISHQFEGVWRQRRCRQQGWLQRLCRQLAADSGGRLQQARNQRRRHRLHPGPALGNSSANAAGAGGGVAQVGTSYSSAFGSQPARPMLAPRRL